MERLLLRLLLLVLLVVASFAETSFAIFEREESDQTKTETSEHPPSDSKGIMSIPWWMLCVTLLVILLGPAGAASWLPAWIVPLRFRHRQRLRNRNTNTCDGNESNEDRDKNATGGDTEQKKMSPLSLLPWWEDSWGESILNTLPLSSLSSSSKSEFLTGEEEEGADPVTTTNDELSHLLKPTVNENASVLHFCFLCHGHRSCSTDLSYMQRSLQHYSELEKHSKSADNYTGHDTSREHDMVVYCPKSNEGKTSDGVLKGGNRLVQEILEVIRNELQQRHDDKNDNKIQDITVSIVGNSLGGIYGRYAVAKLAEEILKADDDGAEEEEEGGDNLPSVILLDRKYRLHFNIFCTTASPHLGISKHTYVPLPRTAEIGAAYMLGETGRDLFRLNDVMKTLATSETYLGPLRKFRKRVAYANAYATDFPVPASTAAFLSDQSTYPHYFSNNSTDGDESQGDENQTKEIDEGYIIAKMHTKASSPPSDETWAASDNETLEDGLVQMSNSLDRLGWQKIFIDIRKEIPLKVVVPKSIRDGLSSSLLVSPKRLLQWGDTTNETKVPLAATTATTTSSDDGESGESSEFTTSSRTSSDSSPNQTAIARLKKKGIVESRDIASLVSTPEDMQLHFPIGHNLLVALSRDGIPGRMYKGGRPVMDAFAKQLVQDIFGWNMEEEKDDATKTLEIAAKQGATVE